MPEPRPPLLSDDQRTRLRALLEQVFDELLQAHPYARASRPDLTRIYTRFAIELGQLADGVYATRKERVR